MPKRIVDGEGLWRSGKLSRVEPIRARAEYANLIPLALANGSFECSARLIWSQVYAFNRPDVTPEDVEIYLKSFEDAGLLFRWAGVDGKQWAYFVGIDKPGRLPGKSRKGKNEKIGAEPPPDALRKFLESKNFPGFGFGSGIGIGSGGKEGAPRIGAPKAQDKPRPSPSVFTGLHLTVSPRQDHSLAEAFPWVDRQAEYRKADAWIEANPERRPRKTTQFIHNWFSKIASPSSPRKRNSVGKNLLQLSQRTPGSSSDVARELLRNFAAMIGLSTGRKFVPEPELFDIWGRALQDLSPSQIHTAGERLMKIWRYPSLPIPGDVRAQIDDAENKGLDLEAANEWEKVLDGIHWSGLRRFPPATEQAIRAAGGTHFIERCSESELVWCRKTFVASYKNTHQTGAAENLLGNVAARRILAQLRAGPPIERKRLPCEEGPSQPPSRDEVRAVLNGVIERPAGPQESEELGRRWAAQKKRLLERAAELGIGVAQKSPAEPEGNLLKPRERDSLEASPQKQILVGR